MPNNTPNVPGDNRSPDCQCIQQFSNAWENGQSPKIKDYLPESDSPSYLATLRELVVCDLEFRWKQPVNHADDVTLVRPPTTEDYIDEFSLSERVNLADEIAKEEFIIRRRFGDAPAVQEFINRIPRLSAEFERLDKSYPIQQESSIRKSLPLEGAPQIANYEIIRKLGEGGMGAVYFARQVAPVRRDVALKVIRCGSDSRELIVRFEAERQALAIMDHPNIAKVLDGGVTQTGLPYFAMEHISGLTITEYCENFSAPLEERLELFSQACRAVQHAHQKGILHRDLKPSNILVTKEDGQAKVKVIDFGLAKAAGDQETLTQRTLQTQLGQIVGTPQYMSPEQASWREVDVDTRSDVYSLGTVLYELLTGTPPLEQEFLKSKAFDEVLRAIREVEPEKPSFRLKRRSNTTDSHVGNWSITRLRQSLSGDLDWIVMRAIEKDRERRYESPLAIIQDVERYRTFQPVAAGPPSAFYRMRKFTRRFAIPLSIATSFFLLLVGSAVAMGMLGFRAMQAEHQALDNLQEAQEQEQLAIRNQLKAQRLAKESQQQAAVLALRQAEASMGSSDVAQGLLWYLHALQLTPEDSIRLSRVARENLGAWSKKLLPVVRQQNSGEEFYLEDGSPHFYQNVEMIGNNIFAKLVQSPVEAGDTGSKVDISTSGNANAEAKPAAYGIFDGDTFQLQFSPIAPQGIAVDYWIDANSDRLVTLHLLPDQLDQESASLNETLVPIPSLEYRNGTLLIDQWSLTTGEPIVKTIRLAGGYLENLDQSFSYRSMKMNLELNNLLHFDPAKQQAQIYDLASAEKLGEPIECYSADLSRDGYSLATGHSDGSVKNHIWRENHFEERATHQLSFERSLFVQCSDSNIGGASLNGVFAVADQHGVHFWDSSGTHLSRSFEASVRGICASGNAMFIGLAVGAIVGWDVSQDSLSLLMNECDFSMLDFVDRFSIASDGVVLKVWDPKIAIDQPVFQARSALGSIAERFWLSLETDATSLSFAAGFQDGRQRFFQIDPWATSPELLVREIRVPPSSAGAYVQALSQIHGRRDLISRINVEDQTELFDCKTGQSIAVIASNTSSHLFVPIGMDEDATHINGFTVSPVDGVETQLLKVRLSEPKSSIAMENGSFNVIEKHPSYPAVLVGWDTVATAPLAGDRLARLHPSNEVSILNLDDGSVHAKTTLDDRFQWELLLASASNQSLMIASSTSNAVRLYDGELAPLGPLIELPDSPGSPRYFNAAHTPNLSHIFLPASHDSINLRDGTKKTFELEAETEIVAAEFNHSGEKLALCFSDATFRIVDFPDLEETAELKLPGVGKRVLRLNDDAWIVVMGARRWMRIDGTKVVEGGVFGNPPADVRLSHDRSRLMVIRTDNSMQLWDTLSGRKLGPPETFFGNYLESLFLADDSHFAVLSDQEIAVFSIGNSQFLDDSKSTITKQIEELTGASLVDGQIVKRASSHPASSQPIINLQETEDNAVEFWKVSKAPVSGDWPQLLYDGSVELREPSEAGDSAPFPPAPVIDPSA